MTLAIVGNFLRCIFIFIFYSYSFIPPLFSADEQPFIAFVALFPILHSVFSHIYSEFTLKML